MNCVKCNAMLLSAEAKFCTNCGYEQPKKESADLGQVKKLNEQGYSDLVQKNTNNRSFETNEGESVFTATIIDLIVVNILSSLLITFTLGIGLPWAIVYRYRWKLEHTKINGRELAFSGTGGQVIGSFIKWFLLTIITLGIYGLWVPIKIEQWKLKNTYFKDLGNDSNNENEESYFTGGVLGYLGINFLSGFLMGITLSFALPWVVALRQEWHTKHQVVNGHRFKFIGKGGNLFGQYIKWFFLTIITLGIYGLWVPLKFKQWNVKNTFIVNDKKEQLSYYEPKQISNNQRLEVKATNPPVFEEESSILKEEIALKTNSEVEKVLIKEEEILDPIRIVKSAGTTIKEVVEPVIETTKKAGVLAKEMLDPIIESVKTEFNDFKEEPAPKLVLEEEPVPKVYKPIEPKVQDILITNRKGIKLSAKVAMKDNYGYAILGLVLLSLVTMGSILVVPPVGAILISGGVAASVSAFYLDISNHHQIETDNIFRGFKQFAKALKVSLRILLGVLIRLLIIFAVLFVTEYIFGLIVKVIDSNYETLINVIIIIGAALIAAEFVLGIISLIRYNLQVYFSFYIIVDPKYNRLNAKESVALSKELTKGHLFKIFVYELSYILWYFGIIFTGGILLFYFYPYYNTAKAKYYLAFKNNQFKKDNLTI